MVSLPELENANISLINSVGQKIKVFDNKAIIDQQLKFGADLKPGFYFLLISKSEFKQTFKLIKK